MYDSEMNNHYFLMTEDGLDCTECEEENDKGTEQTAVKLKWGDKVYTTTTVQHQK